MISRRSFLKYAGLAAAAAGTGFAAGKFSNGSSGEYFTLQGFLPEDEKIIDDLFTAVRKKIPFGSSVVINASGLDKEKIKKLFSANKFAPGKGTVTIKMNRITEKVSSDILLTDSNNFIYDPEKDNSLMINRIREQIRMKPADIYFSLEYKETGFMSSLFNTGSASAVFMNEKGIAEKVSLSKDYPEIIISGQSGNTIAEIRNGNVRVINSCCRNKICTHAGYKANAGDIIACAPNKVLIKIENV